MSQKNDKHSLGASLVAQWLGLHASIAGGMVQPLVREQRYCMLHGAVKKKKKNKEHSLVSR